MSHSRIDPHTIASLREIGEGDPGFLAELKELYARQYEQRAPELRELTTAGKLDKIAGLLHLIKSASGNLGALEFHEFCDQAESLARHGRAEEVKKIMPCLLAAYREVAEAIERVEP